MWPFGKRGQPLSRSEELAWFREVTESAVFLSRAAFSCSLPAGSLTAARGAQSQRPSSLQGSRSGLLGWGPALWQAPLATLVAPLRRASASRGHTHFHLLQSFPAGLLSFFTSSRPHQSMWICWVARFLLQGRQVLTLQEAQCRGSAGGRAPSWKIPEDLG